MNVFRFFLDKEFTQLTLIFSGYPLSMSIQVEDLSLAR
ncbi:hypothetical protein APED_18395 [Acanthopleuribacter pedis]